MAERPQLNGWGQIAAYLSVSIRAAQVYERERGLPVHRMSGPMGRVWAITEELEAWKQDAQMGPSSNRHSVLPTGPAKLIPGSNRRLFLGTIAASAATMTGIVYGLTRMVHAPKQPADWRVLGDTLAVVDRGGGEI